MRSNRAPALLIAFAVLAGQACSDASRPAERTVFVEADDPRGILPPGEMVDDAGRPAPPNPEQATRILVIAGEDERTMNVRSILDLSVILFDNRGEPVPQEQVYYELESEQETDAQLSALSAFTDDNGYARVQLNSGQVLGEVTVRAWNALSRVVEFRVTILELPVGGLDVGFDVSGPVPVAQVEVYLVADRRWCEDPYYLVPPDNAVRSADTTINDRVTFDGLIAGERYSVVVRGRLAANGTLAAGGCFGDVAVPENELRRVDVPVFLLSLNPAGTYTVDNNFDFTDAIPGTLGDVITQLVRFFGDQNRDREIAGLIFDLVETLAREAAGALGALAIDLIRGWVEDDLNRLINDYIDNDGPDWLRDFFTIGADLVSVVSNTEVISRMRITKPRSDGSFDGSQNWIGMAFYWRLGCTEQDPPDCGRNAFTMDEIVRGAEGVQLVFGQFTGRIRGYNEGVIDAHGLDLQYGRLILFVLNNLLLPRIADGANNIRDALLNLGNCPGFANGLTGGRSHLRLGGINIISRDAIEGWCTTILGVAGDVAASILGGLRIDTRMRLSGEMLLVEETDDLQVDAIVEGVWNGRLSTAEDMEQAPPFDGRFEGTRD
jgi:hypothetical protein